ncbi:MAG: protein disulfide oxidoreductase [Gammaproteobacteria bacterium]|nr:protein disulfide oxidoreductase [Gammaproteobacteria bacterium]MBU1776477.1 protein disulfide oxidoreductase [Gammaproteobacteria bacterium]MBU1968894.1 protein disulfide oxidoreductase [Gammaproteobacteria bacterium]
MTSEKPARSRLAKWRGFAIEALVVIAIVVAIRAWQQRDMVSGPAPALQGITLAGKPYTLPTRPERPVLVHFWATWCPVCRAEQGNVASVAQDHSEVITIAMQSGKSEEVARYVQEQQIGFPVINDADGSIAASWGVQAVPASFFIGSDGQIRSTEVGYTTEIGMRLRLWWAGR